MQHFSTQNIKVPDIYKIKDGLHDVEVMGKKWIIKGQMFCKDSLVFFKGIFFSHSVQCMESQGPLSKMLQNDTNVFHKNVPSTFPPNVL